MSKSNLTAERLREALHYDPLTGLFTWRVRVSKCIHIGDVAGCFVKNLYCFIRIDGVMHRSHRLAWLYMTGNWPINFIDHKDGNKQNNTFENLRDVTRQINNQNRHVAKSESGVVGVTFEARYKDKWVMKIRASNGENIKKRFATFQEAVDARAEHKRLHHQ